jgi:hypothetical protein
MPAFMIFPVQRMYCWKYPSFGLCGSDSPGEVLSIAPKEFFQARMAESGSQSKNQKGAASGPRPFKFYVTDELASLTNRVTTGRKNIPGSNKILLYFPFLRKGLHRNKIQVPSWAHRHLDQCRQ